MRRFEMLHRFRIRFPGRGLVLVLLTTLHLGPANFLLSDDLPNAESVLERARSELGQVAVVCDSLEMKVAADVSRQWLGANRSDQTLLYIPDVELDVDLSSAEAKQWNERFEAIRTHLAKFLYSEATQVAEHDEAAAYRMLWHCLRENQEQKDAKRVLSALTGPLTATPRLRTGTSPVPELNWAPRTYTQTTTPHFNLLSQADRRDTLEFASKLEQFYVLWTQVFFSIWAAPGELQEAIQDARPLRVPGSRERIDVVLLPNRAAYINLLQQAESQVGISVGYYSPQAKKSFFYIDDALNATMYHELTHQLLVEATRLKVVADAGTSSSLWLIEGVALYMESLANRQLYWTVGGWESPRLQTSRYRGVRDGHWETLSSFAAGGTEAWKANPNVAQLYTHASGVTHLLMDERLQTGTRDSLLQTLTSVYEGHPDSSRLLQFIGNDDGTAKRRYQDGLMVTDRDVAELTASNRRVRELVLCGSNLAVASWEQLAAQNELVWLDVAYSNIEPAQTVKWLGNATKLERLSLEGCAVDLSVMKAVRKLGTLHELDLSDCQVDDELLAELGGHPTLQILWLTRTQVTPAALGTLRSLTKLAQCDLSETQIPNDQRPSFSP